MTDLLTDFMQSIKIGHIFFEIYIFATKTRLIACIFAQS